MAMNTAPVVNRGWVTGLLVRRYWCTGSSRRQWPESSAKASVSGHAAAPPPRRWGSVSRVN